MPEITEEELEKLKEAAERAKALESKASRLEDESKKFKTRAQEAEEKISAAEKAKLEEAGKLEELLKKEREEKAKLSQTLEARTKGVLSEKLRAEMASYAKDAHNVDMLLKISDHKDLLAIDEENLSVSGVEEFVNKARETHSFLFKKKSLDGLGDDDEGKKKQPSTGEEEYLRELDLCTTRKELEAVKKKYGRLDN